MAKKVRRNIDFDPELLNQLDQKRRELSIERGEDISRNQAVEEAVKKWLESFSDGKTTEER